MAYMFVNIDNTLVHDACSLEISQMSKLRVYQRSGMRTVKQTHKKEKFFLAAAGESKQLVVQFRIVAKRRSTPCISFLGKHAPMYHYVNSLIPESIFAQTFSV